MGELSYDKWSTNHQRKLEVFDYSKMKNFCMTQEIINKIKNQDFYWQIILLTPITNKNFVSRIKMNTN